MSDSLPLSSSISPSSQTVTSVLQFDSISRPSPTSQSVQTIRSSLYPRLPLSNLHTHLRNLCDNLTEASTHVSSNIPVHTQIHNALRIATKLTDTTATLIVSFHRACTTTLEDLDLFPQLVSDGLLSATKRLTKSRVQTSEKLAGISEKLSTEFDEAAAVIAATLSNALSYKLEHEEKRRELTTKGRQLAESLEQRRHAAYNTIVATEEALQKHNEAMKRENAAMAAATVGRAAQAGAVMASILATRTILLATAAGAGANAFVNASDMERTRAREERAIQLKRIDLLRTQRAEREAEIARMAELLRGLHIEKGLQEGLFVSLLNCISALDQLAAAMVLAQTLWAAIADGVAGDGSLELLKEIDSLTNEDLMEKKHIVRLEKKWKHLQTWWVAMLDLCTDAVNEVKIVQQMNVEKWNSMSHSRTSLMNTSNGERLSLNSSQYGHVPQVTDVEGNIEVEEITNS